MSRFYYYHYHPTDDFSGKEDLYSDTPNPYDLAKNGYFSDRIYHARNSNARFYVVTFGYEKAWYAPPRTINIDRYTLHFIFDGEGSINNISLKKGHIFITPPNEPYTICQSRSHPMTFGWIALSGKELELMLEILCLPPNYRDVISDEQTETIERIFIDTIYQPHNKKSLPFFLFSRFFRVIAEADISYTTNATTNNLYVNGANRYINMHYAEELSVEDIAKHLHISVSRLRGLFAQELGISPQRAIIEKKMAIAKALMQSENPPTIQRIAEACGYADQGAFSKRFLKETGMTPSDYIKSVEHKPVR